MPDDIALRDRFALSGDEVAEVLGISARLRRSWSESGRLPAPDLAIGGVRRWSVDQIREWLRAGSPPADEWQVRQAAGGRRG